jgi:hypothetical protein
MSEAMEVKAEFGVVTTSPLTVFVIGEGKVNGGPIVECGVQYGIEWRR